jgi:potassium/chloride transporter 4/5/6
LDNCSAEFLEEELSCRPAFPGIGSGVFFGMCKSRLPHFTSLLDNMWPNYTNAGQLATAPADRSREVYQNVPTSFFVLLAIFFPSVTGIFTGLNMSGARLIVIVCVSQSQCDSLLYVVVGSLRSPKHSIPTGTIAAHLTTSVIYLALAIAYAACVAGPVLRDK